MTRTDRRRFPVLLAAIAALLVFIAVDAASSPVQAQTLSADASLKSLSLSDITLSPGFSAEVTSYNADAELASTVTSTTVTAETTDEDATAVIMINGVEDADGAVDLVGGYNVITVEVTAQDGTTTQTYTVTILRAAPEDTSTSTDDTITSLLSRLDVKAVDGASNQIAGYIASNSQGSLSPAGFNYPAGFGRWYTVEKLAVEQGQSANSTPTSVAISVRGTVTSVESSGNDRAHVLPEGADIDLRLDTDKFTKTYSLKSATRTVTKCFDEDEDGNESQRDCRVGETATETYQWTTDLPPRLADGDSVLVRLRYSASRPGMPGRPLVTAPEGKSGALVVNWIAPGSNDPKVHGYEVLLSPPPGSTGSYGVTKVTGGSTTRLPVLLLEPDTAYDVRVRARSGLASGPWSDTVRATTNPLQGTNRVSVALDLDGVTEVKQGDTLPLRLKVTGMANLHAGAFDMFRGKRIDNLDVEFRVLGGIAEWYEFKDGGGGCGGGAFYGGGLTIGDDGEVYHNFGSLMIPDNKSAYGPMYIWLGSGCGADPSGEVIIDTATRLCVEIANDSNTVPTGRECPSPGGSAGHAVQRITARFNDVPRSHDGESEFNFRLAFVKDMGISPTSLREDALTVTGGAVTQVQRVDDRNDLFEITAEPDSDEDVTVTLSSSGDCGESGAICTQEEDPRKLYNSPTATVAGPILTASFRGLPSQHDGETAFSFRIAFNDEIATEEAEFRDHSVEVWGGEVTRAAPVGQRLDLWEVEVEPASDDSVMVSLKPAWSCAATGAVCTTGGRLLSVIPATMVPGPATWPVQITGVAQVGKTLTADSSNLSERYGVQVTSMTYQWLANGARVPGANAGTYRPGDGKQGKKISVMATYTDDRGNEDTVTSGPTEPLAARDRIRRATGLPVISGRALVGHALTADKSLIIDANGLENAVFYYFWEADDDSIPGATGTTYTPVAADVGKVITVIVAYVDDSGRGQSMTSPATLPVMTEEVAAAVDFRTSLRAAANADGSVTLYWNAPDDDVTGYRILRHRHSLGELKILVYVSDTGSTATTYTDSDVVAGVPHSYRVQAIRDGDLGERTNQIKIFPLQKATNSPATGPPSISGTAQVGETLTADISGIADEDGLENVTKDYLWAAIGSSGVIGSKYAYQWLVDGADSGSGDHHAGYNNTTYTLAEDDVGKAMSVRVTFVDDAGYQETLTSSATDPVAAAPQPNSPARGAPTIGGTAQVGDTLTADTSGITDEDGLDDSTFTVQWVREDSVMVASAAGSYTPTDGDRGKAVKVRVSFTDDTGNPETRTSTQTATVEARANSPATGLPTISGTAQVGETLTADTSSIADSDGMENDEVSFQWSAYDNGTGLYLLRMIELEGTYTIEPRDVGMAISVTAIFTDDRGNTESLESAPTEPVAAAANTPATGAPAIIGTAQVGETLTADITGIADADGLTGVAFTYQWLADDAEIAGATGLTYTLADDDGGKAISVRVSFTDDAGNAETLTSTATVAVALVAWSAALTIGTDTSYIPLASGYSAWGMDGTLSADTFTLDGTTYRVLVLAHQSDGLVFGIDPELQGDFKLGIGDVQYERRESSRPITKYRDAYWWEARDLDWSAGDTLEVSLTLTSGTDAPVPQLPLAPPAAWFRLAPENHNGVDGFTFRLHFSQDIATGRETLRDHSLEVTGGSVTGVERVNGSHRIWEITVAPASSGDVTIALPADRTCEVPGAICTADGRKLHNRPEFTVPGPDSGNDSSSEESPADEPTPVWSATMTVEWVHWGWGYYSTSAKQAGSLSPASFEVDGTTYTVNMIETSGWMYIGFDRDLPFGFVLELDGAQFASDDASFQSYSYGNLYQWRGTDLSWNDGDTVEVRLLPTAPDGRATGAPTISGTAMVGETLTANASGIADPDGLAGASFAYQWMVLGRDIDGADGPSLTLTRNEVGRTIRVRVSFTDDAGNVESLTSEATAAVAARPNNRATGAPTISGMARVNRVLRAHTSGIADPDGMADASFAYQWTAGGSDIDGAAGASLTLTPDMAGRAVGVRVSFTDDARYRETRASLSTMPVQPAGQCPGTGSAPTPRSIAVGAIPIVVESTAEKYYVLYVWHQLNSETAVEIPVSVTLGQAGATTLSEQLSALPAERYRVDEFLIAEPGDLDGDCTDDITELGNPAGMNPRNPAPAVEFVDGVVAIPDRETFEALSYQGRRVVVDTHLRGLEFVKFYLFRMDTDRPVVYFMNTETHRAHSWFGNVIGLWHNPLWLQGAMKGEIVYHPNVVAPDGSLGVYRFEFEPQDAYSFEAVAYGYEVLAASMPLLDDNFAYYPMPARALPLYHEERALFDDSRVNVLLEEDIFPDVDFISLNKAEGYGFLRLMSLEDRPDPRDVVIYETLPNELSRVAGIITTVPQTPLSHVNLRAVQDGVPNAFIRDALDNDDIDDLIDSFVHYTVAGYGWTLRAATPAEVDAHYAASRPSQTQTPERDLTVTQITALADIEFDDWTAFGVKAANVAVLGTLGFGDGTVPDGFAVPFHFYDEFMKHNEFYDDIEEMLADPDFQSDFDTQESELKKLRKKIKKGGTPEWIIEALEDMHATYPDGQSLRYRSSTNNEDLPGFSGAGLYDSKTQDPEETKEDGIDKSIKGVWASMWNFRAFTEREFHRIDHLTAAMGVLVHPNYSDELANGVAVSFDPFGRRDGSYYVNTQLGEDLVTNPEAHSVPEEMLLHPDGAYTVTARSNLVPAGQILMSDAQLGQLRRHLEAIHDEFEELYGIGPGQEFAMEIEFKITSENILSIKQARPWVFSPGQVASGAEGAPPQHSNRLATGAPTVNGPARVGETLTVDIASIADPDGLENVAFAYQWQADDTDIAGATGLTYTLTDSEESKAIKVRVSFTDDTGNHETLTSTATDAVAAAPNPNSPATGVPTITGTAQVGETMTANTSDIADADGISSVQYEYQWLADDSDIPEATGSTYTPVAADEGKAISVQVSFADDGGNAETLTSAATEAVSAAPTPNTPATGAPTISGTARVGETLTADTSGIDDADGLSNVQYEYQWLADDSGISGATNATYTTEASEENRAIKVQVNFTDDAGNEETLTSGATDAVAAAPQTNSPATGAPAISGTARVGETLTANASDIADADGLTSVTYSYQWLADDAEIAGATSLTYTLADTDEGKAIKVKVSFTDDADNEETLTSPATGAVAAAPTPNSPATGAPTISGTAQVGETLTANTSEVADADGLSNSQYEYRWLADDAEIAGATSSTYTLADTDRGKAIKVEVTFTDDAGNGEALTSAATEAVATAEPSEPPEKPTGLEATATHDSVTLTWDDPDDDSITGYVILRRIRVNDQGGDFSELVADTGSAATTYTDDEVAASTTYTYRIKAINEHGVSERSRWVHIDTPAPPVPDQPTGLEATVSNGQVVLTWDEPEDDTITGYVILRRLPGSDPEGQFDVLVADTGTAAITYTDDTVSAETRYTYRIKAINQYGASERSRWFHIDTPAAP